MLCPILKHCSIYKFYMFRKFAKCRASYNFYKFQKKRVVFFEFAVLYYSQWDGLPRFQILDTLPVRLFYTEVSGGRLYLFFLTDRKNSGRQCRIIFWTRHQVMWETPIERDPKGTRIGEHERHQLRSQFSTWCISIRLESNATSISIRNFRLSLELGKLLSFWRECNRVIPH